MQKDVNDGQVEGSYYQAEIQHWDFVERNGMGYLEGCATKYATRNRKKHETPEKDLQKAIHYVEKLKSMAEAGLRLNHRFKQPYAVFEPLDFAKANQLTVAETEICSRLLNWETPDDLDQVIVCLRIMLQDALKGDSKEEHY
jgi:hypothetical protein